MLTLSLPPSSPLLHRLLRSSLSTPTTPSSSPSSSLINTTSTRAHCCTTSTRAHCCALHPLLLRLRLYHVFPVDLHLLQHGIWSGVKYCVCFDGTQEVGATFKAEVRRWNVDTPPRELACGSRPFEQGLDNELSTLEVQINAHKQLWCFRMPEQDPVPGGLDIFWIDVEVKGPRPESTPSELERLTAQGRGGLTAAAGAVAKSSRSGGGGVVEAAAGPSRGDVVKPAAKSSRDEVVGAAAAGPSNSGKGKASAASGAGAPASSSWGWMAEAEAEARAAVAQSQGGKNDGGGEVGHAAFAGDVHGIQGGEEEEAKEEKDAAEEKKVKKDKKDKKATSSAPARPAKPATSSSTRAPAAPPAKRRLPARPAKSEEARLALLDKRFSPQLVSKDDDEKEDGAARAGLRKRSKKDDDPDYQPGSSSKSARPTAQRGNAAVSKRAGNTASNSSKAAAPQKNRTRASSADTTTLSPPPVSAGFAADLAQAAANSQSWDNGNDDDDAAMPVADAPPPPLPPPHTPTSRAARRRQLRVSKVPADSRLAEYDSESDNGDSCSATACQLSEGPRLTRRQRRAKLREQTFFDVSRSMHTVEHIKHKLRWQLLERKNAHVQEARSTMREFPKADPTRADLGLDDEAIAELRRKVKEGEMAEQISAEVGGAVWLAKKVVLERTADRKVSGEALRRYAQGLAEDEHAKYFHARMPYPGLAFLRNQHHARALHKLLPQHPEVDAFQCYSPGTYVIVVVYLNELNQEEAAVYVGATWDQTMAERNEQHRERFRLLKDAAIKGNDIDIAVHSEGQRGLHKRETQEVFHFVLTRTSPWGSTPAEAKSYAGWAEMLAQKLLGKSLRKLAPENHQMVDALLIRLVVAFDEHIGAALFGSILLSNGGYPSIEDFFATSPAAPSLQRRHAGGLLQGLLPAPLTPTPTPRRTARPPSPPSTASTTTPSRVTKSRGTRVLCRTSGASR